MHLQIVMDTSGDTRHQFDPRGRERAGRGREAVS
jgi:hypothetical protein